MNSPNNGLSLDKPPRRPSLVARMATKTKSKVRNFKSYKTISLLPRLFRPDSNSWANFDQDTTEFANIPENETIQNTTTDAPNSVLDSITQYQPSTRDSSFTDQYLQSGLFSSPNYKKGNNTFHVKSSLSECSIGSVDKYVGRRDTTIDVRETAFSGISSGATASAADSYSKRAEWESTLRGQDEDAFVDGFWEECKVEVGKTWQIFTGETTAHGYKRTMAQHRGFIGKLLWAVAILSVSCYAMFLLYNTVVQQDLNTVSSSIKSQPSTLMAFPAVTICNLASYDFSRINGTACSSTDSDCMFLEQVSFLQNFQKTPADNATLALFQEFDTKQLDELIGWELNNFIRQCFWNQREVSCSDIFVRSETVTEGCFTFNFDPANLKVTDQVGSFSGLGLVIHVGHFKRAFNIGVPTGIKALLHEPTEFPNTRDQGMLVASGTTTYMSIAKNQYKFLPKPFKAYGTQYCDDTISGRKYHNYTGHGACIADCRLSFVVDKCHCVVYGRDPEIPGIPFCSMVNYTTCYMPTFREDFTPSVCNCSLPCHKVEYSSQLSSASFGRTTESLMYLNRGDLHSSNEDFNAADYVELKVFYRELLTHIEEHVALYNWFTIFGNVGGQLGLFTGASVLTVVEFLELFSLFVWLVLMAAYRMFKVRWRSEAHHLRQPWKPASGHMPGTWRQTSEQP